MKIFCDRSSKKGFTLVELIVVLVILAILAAILIPSMIGWIEKANQSSAVVEARTCLQAAQTIAVERYSAKTSYDLTNDEAETLELAQLKGDIQAIIVDDTATVTKLVYKASNGTVVTYENGEYTFGDGSSAYTPSFGDKQTVNDITSAIKTVLGETATGKLYTSNSPEAAALKEALKENGIDLDDMSYTWTINYAKGGYPKIYWIPTSSSLDGKKAGDTVTVMAYTLTTEHYTVWNAKVITDANGNLSIGSEVGKTLTTVDAGDAQTYDQMIADYNKVTGVTP